MFFHSQSQARVKRGLPCCHINLFKDLIRIHSLEASFNLSIIQSVSLLHCWGFQSEALLPTHKGTIWSWGSARAGWLPRHFSNQEANMIKMTPNGYGCMQLRIIIPYSKYSPLWSHVLFFKIKQGCFWCARLPSQLTATNPQVAAMGRQSTAAWCYKQALQEKESSFPFSRKRGLWLCIFKIPEGMKGHKRNERRERGEPRLARGWEALVRSGEGRRPRRSREVGRERGCQRAWRLKTEEMARNWGRDRSRSSHRLQADKALRLPRPGWE